MGIVDKILYPLRTVCASSDPQSKVLKNKMSLLDKNVKAPESNTLYICQKLTFGLSFPQNSLEHYFLHRNHEKSGHVTMHDRCLGRIYLSQSLGFWLGQVRRRKWGANRITAWISTTIPRGKIVTV